MDGVERVMVLGILAVIVAILSFAWSATDESATPVGALGRGFGQAGSAIPLSSHTPSGDSVVLDETARNRLKERMRANNAAKEAQLRMRWDLMNAGDSRGTPSTDPRGSAAPGGPRKIAQAPGVAGPGRANGQQGQSQAPDLPEAAGNQPVARRAEPMRVPSSLDLPAPGVLPSQQISLKPPTTRNRSHEDGEGQPPATRLYTLVEGDTLWGIAHRRVGGGDTDRILALIEQLNPGIESSKLSVGRTIKLPVSRPTRPQAQPQIRTPATRAQETSGRVYTVGEGDTLGAIASNELGAGGRWVEIYELNKSIIPDPGQIRPGQRLILPEE